jgi:D-amino-acid dehydrogenase
MKITIIDSLSEDILLTIMSENILCRPDLKLRSQTAVLDALRRSSSDAMIYSTELNFSQLSRWGPRPVNYVVRIGISLDASQPQTFTERLDNGFISASVVASDQMKAYVHALETLESLSVDQLALTEFCRPSELAPRREVMVVGAGLVNLVTAYRLVEEGWKVRILDGAPDPASEAPWKSFGCSRGGDDARMFTLSEMDNYNDRSLSPTMNGVFNSDASPMGWRVCRPGSLSREEQSWILDYEVLSPWLASRYNKDIFSLNRESRVIWDHWREREPDLFSNCETREDILRLYSDPKHLRDAVERQNRIGATIQVLSPEDICALEPTLVDPVRSGAIAGGILVVGFTVNAHKFISQLVSRMTARGATFEWNRRVNRVLFDRAGSVEGLACGTDEIVEAENYVLSPGAYGESVLEGTLCEGRIHGVLGAWLRLPNLEPRLEHSLKLARKGHITEDANVTVAIDCHGVPIVIIGSGYGYTGVDPFNVDESLLQRIYDGLLDTAKRFFPQAYAASQMEGTLEDSLKYCVRPWTSNGLGLFEMRPTKIGGRFIITGGHNTGGFAQSPAIADAVAAGLEGRHHKMHKIYHPHRGMNFLERSHGWDKD